MEQLDAVVIGAGVVGLACARALAQAGREVLILESAAQFGTGISSRSSEVIHAGLYYPAGSWRARCCMAGRARLYAYCAARGIAHRRLGKLVVATDTAQTPALATLARQAAALGVPVELLSAPQAQALEPALRCVAALHSPETGIIDSHALMQALLADAEAAGAQLVCHAPVAGGQTRPGGGLVLQVGGIHQMEIAARQVVNAAGLGALPLARRWHGLDPKRLPASHYARGNYFALSGKAPFQRLIYPLPEPGGLGIHLTLDLGGQARFGPDVEWLDAPGSAGFDYRVAPARAARFYPAIRRYWPELPDQALQPAHAGIRPKIHAPHEPAADFCLQGPQTHGHPGLVELFGIESPGLTSSLALAEVVMGLLVPGAFPGLLSP
ncbi:MAG: NAD(P)/FAD-dependent oxidoreductase [Rhodocyclales bacterium]|nr:NAD(P)/FAD-dependent oxidoreductase [Rhodocyclales bacterium]